MAIQRSFFAKSSPEETQSKYFCQLISFMKNLSYQQILTTFLEKNYSFVSFSTSHQVQGELLLRHDIDFDVLLANQLSFIEDSFGVKSTYFFMLRSKSYNLFETENVDAIFSMIERGHHISLHFDPTIYTDFSRGLQEELIMFKKFFDVSPECISLHRPNDFFLKYDRPIDGIRHTYQSIYTNQIKYFSDSQGTFQYGHPLESDEFIANKSIQLLIHPIWWMINGNSPVDTLSLFLDYHTKNFQSHMARNCKPYQQVLEKSSGCDRK